MPGAMHMISMLITAWELCCLSSQSAQEAAHPFQHGLQISSWSKVRSPAALHPMHLPHSTCCVLERLCKSCLTVSPLRA